jgi:gliding motility-associated-like protein
VIATPLTLGNKEYIVTSTSSDPDCPANIDTAFIEVVTTPSPNAGVPDSVCLGEPISLNGALSNTNNNAVWLTFNPGIISPTVNFLPNFSVPNPTVTTDKPGIYYFILRETSQLCGQYKDTVAVTVIKPEQILQGYNPSCFGQTDGEITVDNQFADEYSYDNGVTWLPDSNLIGFAAGTYTVCSRNYLGCDTCASVVVPEGPQIGMDVSNDTLICENGTASLNGFGSGGISFFYHWDHTADQAALQPVNPVTPRFYKVYVENEGGCLSNTDSIYVDILPPLEMTNSADTAVCPGETAYMLATAAAGNGGPYNFKWSHGPETNGTNADEQSVQPASTTTYTLTVSDNCETSPLSATFEIEISPLPVPAFLVEEDSICEPAVFRLYNNTDPLLSESTFWEISSGDNYTDLDSIVTTPYSYGSYDVTLTVLTPDGCVNTTTVQGFLKSMVKPHSAFRFNPNPVTMFNTKLNFSNYSLGAQHFEWYFPSGAPNYSEEESVAVQYPDGVVENYPVNFVAISDFGCRDTSMQIVEVLSEVILYVPNTFTPNDDLFNNTWSMSIAGIEIESFELTVYNRWGEEVFRSHDIDEAWDGRYSGEIVSDGLYSYIIRANDAISTENYQWSGNLNVIK